MVVSLHLEKLVNSKKENVYQNIAHKNGYRKHQKTFENPTLFSLFVVRDAGQKDCSSRDKNDLAFSGKTFALQKRSSLRNLPPRVSRRNCKWMSAS